MSQDASGAVAGCPPHVRIAHKLTCGFMRQPAWDRKLFAGLVGARTAAAKPKNCTYFLSQHANARQGSGRMLAGAAREQRMFRDRLI